MDTEQAQEPRRKPTFPWTVIAVLTGLAFAIVALTHAGGIAYIIVAIVAAACYTIVGAYYRRHQ
jgi:uncharacterized membrane protein